VVPGWFAGSALQARARHSISDRARRRWRNGIRIDKNARESHGNHRVRDRERRIRRTHRDDRIESNQVGFIGQRQRARSRRTPPGRVTAARRQPVHLVTRFAECGRDGAAHGAGVQHAQSSHCR